MIYVDHKSFNLDPAEIVKRLPREVTFEGINHYVDGALKYIHLSAVYSPAFVEERKKNSVKIGQVWFTSSVLSLNLEKVERLFPYVISCGHEYDEVAASVDMLERYYYDAVANTVLRLGQEKLRRIIEEKYLIEKTSRMNPGSLQDWPLEQQEQLFNLLGEDEIYRKLKVTLTDSYLMLPQKTVAGITYPTRSGFESCQICDRENCPQRRAPFDENKRNYYLYAANG